MLMMRKLSVRIRSELPIHLPDNQTERCAFVLCSLLKGEHRMRSRCLPFLICGLPLLGQQAPKVVEQSGHLAPVMVKVTFLNDASRNVMLRGFGIEANNSFGTHQYVVRADGGASTRRIWTDSIAVIKGTGSMRTRNSEFTIVLKNGTEVPVQFTGMNCAGELDQSTPAWDCRVIHLQ